MLTAWPARWSCLRRGRRSAPASTPCASSRNLKKECEKRVLKNVPTCLEKHSFIGSLNKIQKRLMYSCVHRTIPTVSSPAARSPPLFLKEKKRRNMTPNLFFFFFRGETRCVSSSFWKSITEPKWKKLLKLSVKKSDDDGQINYPSYLSKV